MNKAVVSNFLIFQVGWFACVLGGAHGMPWLGVWVVAVAAGWHLFRAPDATAEGPLLIAAAAIGATFDSLLVAAGWVDYPSGQPVAWMAPVWIVAMWVLFATTLNVSLRWLRPWPAVAVLFGAVGGPLAYYGGSTLGGVTFTQPVPALMALCVGWALVTPLLFRIAGRFDGWRPPAQEPLAVAADQQGA